jgi:hypothetical protein
VGFLQWLEMTRLADWVNTSLLGYPLMISSHAIGMAVMVGLAFALDLRLLGRFPGIPYAAFQRFIGLAWLGFGLNFLSGAALFTTRAASYVLQPVFVIKIALVFAGAITIAMLQPALARDSAGWGATTTPGRIRAIAYVSIVCWVGAIVTGRLIAYL